MRTTIFSGECRFFTHSAFPRAMGLRPAVRQVEEVANSSWEAGQQPNNNNNNLFFGTGPEAVANTYIYIHFADGPLLAASLRIFM